MRCCRAEDLGCGLRKREYASPKRVALVFFHFWKKYFALYLCSAGSLETTLDS